MILAAPNRGEFLEGVEIAVLTLRVLAGDVAAAAELDTRRATALDEARHLPTNPMRGEGDVWGVHKRRLAAHPLATPRPSASCSN